MNVDPNTEVRRIIEAFPAALHSFEHLGIDVTSNEPLYKACEAAGIGLADVQAALANIDWTQAGDDSGD
jgi:hypothetical protein